MGLYSYKGQEPSKLPFRVTLDDGQTRTSLDELTPEELNELGFSGPIVVPTFDAETQELSWDGTEYIVVDYSQEELDTISQMKLAQERNINSQNLNYVLFWDELIKTNLYKKIRARSLESLPVNTICTELISIFGDAKSGNPNQEQIQKYISIIFLTFDLTSEEIEELNTCMNSSNLNLQYNIPDEQYLERHTYNQLENQIEFLPEVSV